jgi:hypothetical protein
MLRARRRQGTRRILVDVSEGDVAALVARTYLPEEASHDPATIKAAIESVIADLVFELESERAIRHQLGKRVTANSVTRDEPVCRRPGEIGNAAS